MVDYLYIFFIFCEVIIFIVRDNLSWVNIILFVLVGYGVGMFNVEVFIVFWLNWCIYIGNSD